MVTVEQIRELLETRNVAVEKAILTLYEHQTRDEQETETTKYDNGVGFNGLDAEFLSSLAKQMLANRYGRLKGSRLTENQMKYARKKVMKYAGQLVKIANAKGELAGQPQGFLPVPPAQPDEEDRQYEALPVGSR